MLFKKILIAILGLPAVLLITCSQAYATKMIVAVDPSFTDVVVELTLMLQSYYLTADPGHIINYEPELVVKPSADLRDDILKAVNDWSPAPYDILISANSEPSHLHHKYLFGNPILAVSKPFQFTKDSVILYSGWMNAVDISTGFPKPLNQLFIMADPVIDAYGAATEPGYEIVRQLTQHCF